LAEEAAHKLLPNIYESSDADPIESAILKGVKLVLEWEPSEAMEKTIEKAVREWVDDGVEIEPPMSYDVYHAVTRELLKELDEL
jgi:hypothetical protein